MIISVIRKEVYGRELFYPANEAAKVIVQLLGSKTLSRSELGLLQKAGAIIKFETPILDRLIKSLVITEGDTQ